MKIKYAAFNVKTKTTFKFKQHTEAVNLGMFILVFCFDSENQGNTLSQHEMRTKLALNQITQFPFSSVTLWD